MGDRSTPKLLISLAVSSRPDLSEESRGLTDRSVIGGPVSGGVGSEVTVLGSRESINDTYKADGQAERLARENLHGEDLLLGCILLFEVEGAMSGAR